ERGELWVVEMSDYPHGPAEGEPPRSRIRRLTDRNGDGRYETAETFADKLLFATGVQPWKSGLIVTMAGEVAYLKDSNGDGRADVRETWYTGFAEENSQLRANHPTFGLDNRVYVANGLRGGTVVDARRPDAKPANISGMDFRFDPHSGDYAAVTGVGQFGLTFDDFGNRFVCSNRNPLIHIVLQNETLARNPTTAIAAASGDVARSGFESKLFPISRAWTTSNLHANQFTAACGVTIYRGDRLPEAFHGNAFTCDPTGNLVHREVIHAAGMSFASQPGREGVEFLASPDEWFRPVNLSNGPDGALYVVDMYRAVIEHPQFMPEELKRRPDLMLGNDRGRIWRIVAEAAETVDESPRRADKPIADLSTPELVALLDHTNSWQRDTAARLIYERQDSSAVEPLKRLLEESPSPIARVHALHALAGLGQLNADHISTALKDASPRVREQALLLFERTARDDQSLRQSVLRLSSDDDAKVRGALALALVPIAEEAAEVTALAEIAVQGADDVWTRRVVSLAAGAHVGDVLAAVLKRNEATDAVSDELIADLAAAGAARPEEAARQSTLRALVASLDAGDLPAQRPTSVALLKFCQSLARGESLSRLRQTLSAEQQTALDGVFQTALRQATDEQVDEGARAAAIALLVYDSSAHPKLADLAAANASQAVRLAAIGALARTSVEAKWPELLGNFRSESPAVRTALLNAVLARANRTQLLLDEIEAGHIKPSELDRVHSTRLLSHPDTKLRQTAARLFADAIPADRQQVLADYQIALSMPADTLRGRAVFQKNCATCHRIGDVGVNVAPDISDSRTKQPSQLLADILQPNRAIDNNYVNYVVVTEDGQSLSGIVAAETATSVTFRQPENKAVTLLRTDIAEMRSTGQSLMPEGLERNISLAEMADLLSFIKNWRYLDGQTPLENVPTN
ncbi:MAG: c-type cytochrome, partial [Planctomycetales bacterium]|nr:c-type cytochrome [Planctomycetales bacterium]